MVWLKPVLSCTALSGPAPMRLVQIGRTVADCLIALRQPARQKSLRCEAEIPVCGGRLPSIGGTCVCDYGRGSRRNNFCRDGCPDRADLGKRVELSHAIDRVVGQMGGHTMYGGAFGGVAWWTFGRLSVRAVLDSHTASKFQIAMNVGVASW